MSVPERSETEIQTEGGQQQRSRKRETEIQKEGGTEFEKERDGSGVAVRGAEAVCSPLLGSLRIFL